jgi:hypothetical protein
MLFRGREYLTAAACAAMLVSACHVAPAKDDPQARFTDLWRTYSHCRATSDLGELLTDASRLNRGAASPERPVPTLLKPVKSYISPPATRVSADPRDMAEACSLKAADAALAAGWTDVAIALYKSLLPLDGEESGANYYARQAETGLAAALMKQHGEETDPVRLRVRATEQQEAARRSGASEHGAVDTVP